MMFFCVSCSGENMDFGHVGEDMFISFLCFLYRKAGAYYFTSIQRKLQPFFFFCLCSLGLLGGVLATKLSFICS